MGPGEEVELNSRLKANGVIGILKRDVIRFKPFTLSLKPSGILTEHHVSGIEHRYSSNEHPYPIPLAQLNPAINLLAPATVRFISQFHQITSVVVFHEIGGQFFKLLPVNIA